MPRFVPRDGSTAALAGTLGDALLAGDSEAASQTLNRALAEGRDAAAVFDEVVAPAMTIIGKRWEDGLIGVADEHLATELVTRVLQGIRPGERPPRRDLTVMLAGVEGERHVMGLRMAADLLEDAGFRALYLGADVPEIALVPLVRRRAPDVLVLSATMPGSEETLRRAVSAIRATTPCRIVAGGPAAARAFAPGDGVIVLSDVSSVIAAVAAVVGPAAETARV